MNVRAILLAAGRGSRMGKLTADKPKCLVRFRGKPLLEWQIEALKGVNITSFAIVRGYNADLLHIPNFKYFNNKNWNETNMVTSLVCADRWLRESTCVVSYSDIIYSSDAVRQLLRTDDAICITYDPKWLSLWRARFSNPLIDAETFRVSNRGFVQEIGRKPNSIHKIHGQYMGLLKFTKSGWQQTTACLNEIPLVKRNLINMTELLDMLIQKNIAIRAVPIRDRWLEVDSASDLALYHTKSFNSNI